MKRKRLIVNKILFVAVLSMLFPAIISAASYNLKSSKTAKNKEFILETLKEENNVVNLKKPVRGKIKGLELIQKVGERPTFTFVYSKLGNIFPPKEAKVEFSISGTGDDKRSITMIGKIKIDVGKKGTKFLNVSVVDNVFVFSGTTFDGTSVTGTMSVDNVFTASGNMLNIHSLVLFKLFEAQLGIIDTEVGTYTWSFKITGIRQRYKGRLFTTFTGDLNVIE